jgi:hypothetical protein
MRNPARKKNSRGVNSVHTEREERSAPSAAVAVATAAVVAPPI